jgi:hypothetical protein
MFNKIGQGKKTEQKLQDNAKKGANHNEKKKPFQYVLLTNPLVNHVILYQKLTSSHIVTAKA